MFSLKSAHGTKMKCFIKLISGEFFSLLYPNKQTKNVLLVSSNSTCHYDSTEHWKHHKKDINFLDCSNYFLFIYRIIVAVYTIYISNMLFVRAENCVYCSVLVYTSLIVSIFALRHSSTWRFFVSFHSRHMHKVIFCILCYTIFWLRTYVAIPHVYIVLISYFRSLVLLVCSYWFGLMIIFTFVISILFSILFSKHYNKRTIFY